MRLSLGNRIDSVSGGGILSKSTFYSDGLIENNKLKAVYGSIYEPALVDSNCLIMAIDDTISFASLSGWSIISKLGTATIIINGNTIKCTGAGTLYNLILSDGTNQHTYPLAEGGYTIAFDTYSTPSHGTINCASLLWGLQSEYHKNIEGYNTRTGIDILRQSTFTDSGTGVPVGWVNAFGNATITTTSNVVRVTKGNSTDYFRFNISKNSILTNGVTYKITIRIRGSVSGKVVQCRLGTTITAIVTVTTEWQTLSTPTAVSNSTTFGLTGASEWLQGEWFEFDYVLVEQSVSSHKVPKRISSNFDAQGFTITTLGNGYFIDCETKLLFPDLPKLIEVDDHVEFFYNKLGVQNKWSYSQLNPNMFGWDRILTTKTDGRLTQFVVCQQKDFTRTQFINYLNKLGRNTYIYTKIENGAFVYFSLKSAWNDGSALSNTYEQTTLNTKGVLRSSLITKANIDAGNPNGAALTQTQSAMSEGNTFHTQRNGPYGCSAFETLPGEETLFASEIASGDLIVVDAPAAKRMAYVKLDVLDYTAIGTLVNTTKTAGTTILSNASIFGYANLIWIPAGQSGVPAELSEVVLNSPQVSGSLLFKMYTADAFFGKTFTNNDAINVYVIPVASYMNHYSKIGMKCYMNHHRSVIENYLSGIKISGWLEGHPGDLVGALISSEAAWDAGMCYTSSGGRLQTYKSTLFSNQNNPRYWCGCMGHTLWTTTPLATVLSSNLPTVSSKNQIVEGDFIGWGLDTTSEFDSFISKCDELGIIILSPLDIIKNFTFNDYVESNFYKA